jgi:hypothetical protein
MPDASSFLSRFIAGLAGLAGSPGGRCGFVLLVAAISGCASQAPSGFGNTEDAGGGTGGEGGAVSKGGMDGGLMLLGDGAAQSGADGAPVAVCPPGLQCNVTCSAGTTTTISGKVYDPAGKVPLYNIAVYVPQGPLAPLPAGVLAGADACSCGALFKSGAVVSTTTGVDGSFTLSNAPVGTNVPLVVQVGKWRRQVTIDVQSCQDNPQPDKSLKLPSTLVDPNDSMPQIAVSTGFADTLECLMLRMGLPATEYVAGPNGAGHVHVFSGGQVDSSGGGTGWGAAESPPMANAPASWTSLWDTQADLMPYDLVLLSCEGEETHNINAPVLEQYLNAGGRAFASHYHYVWFGGTLEASLDQAPLGVIPPPPSDWGPNLAAWGDSSGLGDMTSAAVVQTLTGTTNPFPKGIALDQWLAANGALGVEGAAPGELEIFHPGGDVGATDKAQAWMSSTGRTLYMSFDTPVDAPAAPDGGAPSYCGRAVFSDLHVGGDTTFAPDMNPPPGGCADHDLSPQEKALEFMLFDLSSCVTSDTVPPPSGIPVTQ